MVLRRAKAEALRDKRRSYEWEEKWDDSIGAFVYYNHLSGETVSEKPEGYDAAMKAIAFANAENWNEYFDDEQQRPYFYNKVTEDTVWERPFALGGLLMEIPNLDLKDRWKRFVDDEEGKPYFVDVATGRVTWRCPEELMEEEGFYSARDDWRVDVIPSEKLDAGPVACPVILHAGTKGKEKQFAKGSQVLHQYSKRRVDVRTA